MRFKGLWGLIPLMWLGGLWAQPEKIPIDTIQIQATRLEDLAAGQRLVSLDSATLALALGQNLADLLSAHSDVFIKSYGAGGLATASLRGGSASHLAVRWNGFNLQSATHGQVDLALLPTFFLDEVNLQYGGAGALYGSGAVGGTLLLNQQLAYGQGLRLRAQSGLGSFGQRQAGADLSLSGQNWALRTRYFAQQADNDFPLVGRPDRPRQVNSAVQQRGLLQEGAWRLGEQQHLRFWLWRQEHQRAIPPTLSQDSSAARQDDQSTRLALAWERSGDRLDLQARSALIQERLRFQDPLAQLDADNQVRSWISEAEASYRPSLGQTFHLGLNHTHQRAWADGYGPTSPQQNRLSVLGSYRLRPTGQDWEMVASLRQEWVDGRRVPIMPSLGGRWSPSDWLTLKGQVGRSYRLPTFNDRFWQPGGNPDLRPERGWSEELGLQGQHPLGATALDWSATAFSRQIDDWILWLPNGGFWTPQNVRRVWSRGLEASLEAQRSLGEALVEGQLSYTFTRATVAASAQPRDGSVGQQLIYTPAHQGQARLSVQLGPWSASYFHTYTGQRYTLSDNSAWLAGYGLGHFNLSHAWQGQRFQGALSLRVDNLWNQPYQVIEDRPMPGRSVALVLDLAFFHSSFIHHKNQ